MWIAYADSWRVGEYDGREIAFDTLSELFEAFTDIRLALEFADYESDSARTAGSVEVRDIRVNDYDYTDKFVVEARYAPHTFCEFSTPAECEAALTSDDADDAALARHCARVNGTFQPVTEVRYRHIRHFAFAE